MDFPVITATTAIILAFLQIFLGFLVGFKRLKTKTGIGDGGNEALARQIRVHGNLIENAPIFLILLVLLELTGISKITVAIIGTVFVLGRIAHAYGLSQTTNPLAPLRGLGAGSSTLAIIVTAGMIFHHILSGDYQNVLP